MNFINFAVALILSYACAAAISSHVSMDMTQTDWLNLWTYFWWAVGIPAMTIIVGTVSMVAVLAISAIAGLLQ